MEILIVVTVVCMIAGALIAPSKNISPLEGALWGLLGLIGLLVLACKKPKPEAAV